MANARRTRPRDTRLTVTKGNPDAAIRYAPAGETLIEYHKRRERNQVLIGPLGSAKTTSSIVKMVEAWSQAPVDPGTGLRTTRWAAVRNTYPDLLTTTINDFKEMVDPLKIGKLVMSSPPRYTATFRAADGIETQVELWFLAFDLPDDVKKARGLRLAGCWFNEMKELSKANIDMVQSRVGRYRPDLFNAQPHCWYGSLGDSNAPDKDHWLATMHEQWLAGELPSWWFGIQPGGVIYRDGRFTINPAAENRENLAIGYYEDLMQGKDPYWIRQNLGNEFVFYADGRPVHPEFSQELHVASYPLEPLPGIPLTLGFDWGRTPAGIVAQRRPSGHWKVLKEMVSKNTNAKVFGKAFKRMLDEEYKGYSYHAWGDPSGSTPGQATDDTPFQMVEEAGIDAFPTHTNVFDVRTEALDGLLRELISAQPAIEIDPRCRTLIRGLSGAYQFKRVQVSGEERYHDQPVKGPESHVCEALHYALLGAGEGDSHTSSEWQAGYDTIERDYGGWHPDQSAFE